MENQQQQQQQTGLCRAGCGFYGSAVTEGLCSKCFKTNLKRTQDATNCVNQNLSTSLKSVSNDAVNASTSSNITSGHNTNATKNLPVKPTTMVAKILDIPHSEKPIEDFLKTSQNSFNTLSTSSSSSSFGEQSVSPEVVTTAGGKKPNRCHTCKKRVGLTGFLCRCGGLYCSEHRYDKAHDCAFDYKTMEREEIRKNNPVVVSDKIQRL